MVLVWQGGRAEVAEDEWILNQQKTDKQAPGSNVFTYKN